MANEKRLIDEFMSEIKNEFIELCCGNDFEELTLLEIGETIDRIYEKYIAIPTVDAAPVVRGRWINWGKSGTPTYENYGTCSVCHEDAEICTEHRNYCPSCGAKMDLEELHG